MDIGGAGGELHHLGVAVDGFAGQGAGGVEVADHHADVLVGGELAGHSDRLVVLALVVAVFGLHGPALDAAGRVGLLERQGGGVADHHPVHRPRAGEGTGDADADGFGGPDGQRQGDQGSQDGTQERAGGSHSTPLVV
jgi:hypothetical protein